jgi:hypothetical protein
MSGSQYSMRDKGSIRSRKFGARLAFSALLLIAWIPLAFAQEPPPLDVQRNRLPARDPNAIAVDGWLLYPTLRIYSLYSDNLFLSPTTPISVPGFGVTPGMTAEWTNGIHSTTLYGNIDRQVYPTDNELNTLDARAGFTQKYEAMRDLIFSVNGNYSRQTFASGLQNSIQTGTAAPGTTVLPNGNIQLPNGTQVSPITGQVVGQASPAAGSNIPVFVNPFDQYSATFSVDKIFNRGIMSLGASVARTDYEVQTALSSKSRTFTENAAFWLGPLFYAYSSGSIGTVVTDVTSATTTSYRIVGGLGTRQFGLFRASAYFGHQGSEGITNGGGDVYGGRLFYYATPAWTLTGSVDRTINIVSQTSVTDLALTLPGNSVVQIPLSTSSRVTSASLKSSYEFIPQWFAAIELGYTRVEYVIIPRLDNSWILDATVRYDIWRNMSLTWEYRYRSILSNVPFISANSNYGMMGATYKF